MPLRFEALEHSYVAGALWQICRLACETRDHHQYHLMYWFNITTCISNISNMSYVGIASSEGWQFSNFKSGNAGTFSFIPRSSSESNNANWRGAGYQTDRGLISECVSMSMLASMLGPYPAIPDFVLGLAIWRFIISTSSIITSKSNQGELFNLLF